MDKLSTVMWVGRVGETQPLHCPFPLQRRALEIAALFTAEPGDCERIFAQPFIDKVPIPQLKGIFASYYAKLGQCTEVRQTAGETAVGTSSGKFDFIFERDFSVPGLVAIDPIEPHLIEGLSLGNPIRLAGSLNDITEELKALPGEVSFRLVRLGSNDEELIAELNSERILAIGSAFKLYILGELIRSVNAGERKWTDIIMLEPEAVSLPSGILQNWPPGSPLTLYTLAALMISQSDNTAADQLLRTLGRYQVEKILPAMGHSDPMRNVPFLSTVEMFKLKGGPEAGELYLAKDPHTRRNYLESEISRQSHRHLAPLTRPSYIDTIEWFASAADLCQAMNWIRKQTETGPTAMARDILAINPGLVVSKKPWHYIGYKGGSETGVLNVTFLLQAEAGDWYAFAASWNNETQPLDESKFFSLTERIIQLIQTEAGQSP